MQGSASRAGFGGAHESNTLTADCWEPLTKAGFESARKQGKIGGRRPKLRPQQQAKIIQMISKGKKNAAEAARIFGVHPSTVCRLLAASAQGSHENDTSVANIAE